MVLKEHPAPEEDMLMLAMACVPGCFNGVKCFEAPLQVGKLLIRVLTLAWCITGLFVHVFPSLWPSRSSHISSS